MARPGPDFDPDSAALTDGLYGLPHTPDEARVRAIPVPWEATVSYGRGTSRAPEAILRASAQVDLHDLETGEPWREGIAMEAPDARLAAWNDRAVALVDALHDEPDRADADALRAEVDALGVQVNELVASRVRKALANGQIPAVVGGDHSVAYGGLVAAASTFPGLGVLHVDAHCDLRVAYEGFRWSHASVLGNALDAARIGALVQVGIRDLGTKEHARARDDDRVHLWTDVALAQALAAGKPWRQVVDAIVAPLPELVWITFDIDGLDPALCPNTGTPVPGGLSWREALGLLEGVATSGRRIVGFDLVEVGDGEWDANVGARLLYKLAGWAIRSRAASMC